MNANGGEVRAFVDQLREMIAMKPEHLRGLLGKAHTRSDAHAEERHCPADLSWTPFVQMPARRRLGVENNATAEHDKEIVDGLPVFEKPRPNNVRLDTCLRGEPGKLGVGSVPQDRERGQSVDQRV